MANPVSLGVIAKRIPLIILFFFIGIYLWFFGGQHFGEDWSAMSATVSFYMAVFFGSIFIADTRLQKDLRAGLGTALRPYLLFFIFTFIIASLLFSGSSTTTSSIIVPMLVLQICIVAPTEELMFRGVLLSYIGYTTLAIIIQAVIFSIWHWVVYTNMIGLTQSATMALLSAFIFGIVMGYIVRNKRWGLPAVMACHAAFNIAVLGLVTI